MLVDAQNTYYAIEKAYDEKGNVILEKYYGTDGQPTPCADGYCEIHRTYEGKYCVLVEYFDANGQRDTCVNHFSVATYVRDAYGNASEIRYFDTEGRPVNHKNGYAILLRTFDDKKQVLYQAAYNQDGWPVLVDAENTYYAIEKGYDDKGNVILEKYYGPDGKAINCVNGYAEVHRVYNKQKKVTEVSFFDKEGNPTVNKDGAAMIRYTYSSKGKVTEKTQYDLNGEIINSGK